MNAASSIRPIVKDGEKYYVVYLDPRSSKILFAQDRVYREVHQQFAGRDRRRLKREYNKAVKRMLA